MFAICGVIVYVNWLGRDTRKSSLKALTELQDIKSFSLTAEDFLSHIEGLSSETKDYFHSKKKLPTLYRE